jgi:ribonuclease HII
LKNGDLTKEKQRVAEMMRYERQAYRKGHQIIAGLDEAGRGPLAGPVVAAAVILPPDFFVAGINDSKQISVTKRGRLAAKIKQQAIDWAVASVYPSRLDEINILNAAREAMCQCIHHLSVRPDYLLIDALRLHDLEIEQMSLIKGDCLSASIACASILAKVERDMAMEGFDRLYPGYGLAKHKGYATREHIEALHRLGPCAVHRRSFDPIKSWFTAGNGYQQTALFEQEEP